MIIKTSFTKAVAASMIILIGSVMGGAAATIVVTKANDAGPGSLRDAITQANANAQDDTINFDAAFFATARTITLASEIQITADGANPGRLVTINGPGANLLTISGGGNVRLFYAAPESSVSMSGMTLRDGNGVGSDPFFDRAGGALVCFRCYMTLTNMVVRNNTTVNDGGGMHTNDVRSLSIFNSIFRENATGRDRTGGGMYLGGGQGDVNDFRHARNRKHRGLWRRNL